MKKILIPAVLSCALFVACNDTKKEDSNQTTTEHSMMNDTTTMNTVNNSDTGSNNMNAGMGNDADFAMGAADGGMFEVQTGKLAQTNGSTDKVKEFGKMMEKDHSMAGEQLKAWAASNNVSLPATLSSEKQSKYDELAAKKGAEFDKAYATAMVADHEKVISEFRKEAAEGKNAALKSWASGKLPTLQHHLEMAKATNATIKDK